MLYVGRKVVCVNTRNWPACLFNDYDPVLPEEGGLYEILAIMDGRESSPGPSLKTARQNAPARR